MEGIVKRNFDSIDLLKFFLCLMVVAIHSDPFIDFSPLLNRLMLGIERLCVPVFFIASAFFLYRVKISRNNTIRYIKRLFILYLAWFIVSLPITVFNRFSQNMTIGTKLFLFVKSFFFTSTFSGSWFLMSSIFCALLFYFVYSKFPKIANNIILVLSVFFYFLCVFSSGWGNLMDIFGLRSLYDKLVFWFAKPYTSILVGVPYFAIGKYIADKEGNIITPKWYYFLTFLALLLLEVYYTYNYNFSNSTDCYLLLLPCAYLIFVYVLNKDWHIKNAVWLRKTSTIVFFSQFIWLFIIEFLEWHFNIKMLNLLKFIFALIFCLMTAALILYLQKKKFFKWLKYFY